MPLLTLSVLLYTFYIVQKEMSQFAQRFNIAVSQIEKMNLSPSHSGGTAPFHYRVTKRDKELAMLTLTSIDNLVLPVKLMSIFSRVFLWEETGEAGETTHGN